MCISLSFEEVNMGTLHAVHLVIYSLLGITSLLSLFIYAGSKYRYRPYGRESAGFILKEYLVTTYQIDSRMKKLEVIKSYNKNIFFAEDGNGNKVLCKSLGKNKPLTEAEKEQIYKEVEHYKKCRWQLYIAFTIEFQNEEYIKGFTNPKDQSPIIYYDAYVQEHGEAVKSYIEYRIYKYIRAFLKRKVDNTYNYYFYREILFPTETKQI